MSILVVQPSTVSGGKEIKRREESTPCCVFLKFWLEDQPERLWSSVSLPRGKVLNVPNVKPSNVR